jgi:hypothetical protein
MRQYAALTAARDYASAKRGRFFAARAARLIFLID